MVEYSVGEDWLAVYRGGEQGATYEGSLPDMAAVKLYVRYIDTEQTVPYWLVRGVEAGELIEVAYADRAPGKKVLVWRERLRGGVVAGAGGG